ncbi:hypothetical protein K435DRAFT_437516 [Dendrothele bispora CBS 962.96]|uniref:Secreted protein n=1 Tax=Dendrothele bispora (strain CBS 962.96) TaxID=1314807 RepID=A0A4S8MDW3_DENBC|nr:hypothetical protein K435DRAFT_437516 [Dendrothele bispora CBS 962.96]
MKARLCVPLCVLGIYNFVFLFPPRCPKNTQSVEPPNSRDRERDSFSDESFFIDRFSAILTAPPSVNHTLLLFKVIDDLDNYK